MMKDKNEAAETKEGIRKTIYIDETLVKRAELLGGLAGVNSFSAFVSKALEQYISQLVLNKHSVALSEEIGKAITYALNPINIRLSKSLYRYAVQLDMLSQFVGYQNDFNWREIEAVRKEAQENTAKMRGQIDVGRIIGEMSTENEEEGDDYS
jgi:hypothetical protein